MKKLQLKLWVKTALLFWAGLDFILVALVLYMLRMIEIGL